MVSFLFHVELHQRGALIHEGKLLDEYLDFHNGLQTILPQAVGLVVHDLTSYKGKITGLEVRLSFTQGIKPRQLLEGLRSYLSELAEVIEIIDEAYP